MADTLPEKVEDLTKDQAGALADYVQKAGK